MPIVLVSNIPHYHHLAEALANRGLLRQYITCPSLFPGEEPWPILSAYWARKLAGRRLTGVARSQVEQVYLPELLQKLLPRLRVATLDQADGINNFLFDVAAVRHWQPGDTLHFTSSVGLRCARRARAGGGVVVCDVRQEHPAFQRSILEEESARLGVPYTVPGSSFEPAVLEEFALADYLIVPSEHARRTFLERGFTPDRVAVIPYGVDGGMFAPAAVTPAGPLEVLYVGSITLRKGLTYLLEAVAALPPSLVRLTLVGAVAPEMRPEVARFEGRIVHRDAVPKADLAGIYARASVFVMPSLADSFSLATLEAMSAGLPVIVSGNTGARDAVTEGQNGWVVPIRDAEAIRDRLVWLTEHRESLGPMGEAARRAARHYTWERYGQEAVQFYERIGIHV